MSLPSKATLKKYGLTPEDWKHLYEEQNGLCPICEKALDTRVCVDHYHARGYKKMPPEQRKLYVRGLTHWWCNKTFLGRGITVQRARNAADYLERFENRLHENNNIITTHKNKDRQKTLRP